MRLVRSASVQKANFWEFLKCPPNTVIILLGKMAQEIFCLSKCPPYANNSQYLSCHFAPQYSVCGGIYWLKSPIYFLAEMAVVQTSIIKTFSKIYQNVSQMDLRLFPKINFWEEKQRIANKSFQKGRFSDKFIFIFISIIEIESRLAIK